MNPRIQELANEAAKFSAIMALPTGESGDKLFVEKFAELIVRECMDLLEDFTNDIYLGGIEYVVVGASETLQEHFGIEE